jgi:cytoskeletal protein RodZ
MKKVGQVLKEARESANLSLEDIEKKTKIRKRIILALEEGRWDELPHSTYVKGLIKNYGQVLKLSPSSLLALYRREYAGAEPQAQSTFLNLPFKFHPTPILTVTFFGILTFLAVLGYIAFQYFSLVSSPYLSIDSPKDFTQVSQKQIEIAGKTDSDATLSINNENVSLDEQGRFKEQITLKEGLNEIEIKAVSKLGRQKTIKKTVQFVPG